MKTIRFPIRALLALFCVAAWSFMAGAQEEQQNPQPQNPQQQNPQEQPEPPEEPILPKYEDMEIPSIRQLMIESPVDWIRLKGSDEVIVCELIYPRPDTLGKMKKQLDELVKNRPQDPSEMEAWRDKREDLTYLTLVLPEGGENPEYRLPIDRIEEIIYHEELLLRRVDLLIEAGEQRRAFELLYQLERRLPDWPGIEDRKDYLIFMEAEANRKKKRLESALVFYEQLYERKPDYPELKNRLGQVTDSLVSNAATAKDYRRARHYLGRLRRLADDHETLKKWEGELLKRAAQVNEQAQAASAQGKHDEAALLAREAISIWPDAPAIRSDYLKAFRRFQRLHVGVMQLAHEPTEFFLPTAADEREDHLTRTRLFSVNQYQGTPRYSSRFFEQWEPQDLGRRAVFHLSPGRFSWEARPETTATDIINTFNPLLDPNHRLYDERLASYLDSISVLSPLHLEVEFSRVPLRTEALLSFPLRRTEFDARQYQGPKELAEVFSERFRPVERGGDFVRYRRAIPEGDESTEFHVAEIQEHKYASSDDAVQDLLRGKIDMIAGARIWNVDPLIESNLFFVLKHAVPRVHVLQFNPKSEPLRNREFRRALLHSINKERILRQNILRGASSKHARLVTAAYDRGNYAYNTLVEPRSYDPTLAVALRLASERALGGKIPPLRMICDPDPPILAAARRMIADWKRVGIPVELLNNTGQVLDRNSEEWDIIYRTGTMTEPLTELWPFLNMSSRAEIADLDHLPDWLRQELITLDTAIDWKTALAQLKRLHRLLWAEVQLIPLWEVDEYSVYRRHLEGYRTKAVHPYQNIDRWTVDAWIPPTLP